MRGAQAYADLARSVFPDVDVATCGDLLRVPYDHAAITCRLGGPGG